MTEGEVLDAIDAGVGWLGDLASTQLPDGLLRSLVVDGAIPTKDGGIYCKVADRTIQEHLEEAAAGNRVAFVPRFEEAYWGIQAFGNGPKRPGPSFEQ